MQHRDSNEMLKLQSRFSVFTGSSSICNRVDGYTANIAGVVMIWMLLSLLKLRMAPVHHCSICKTGNKPEKSMPEPYTGILSNFIRRPKKGFYYHCFYINPKGQRKTTPGTCSKNDIIFN